MTAAPIIVHDSIEKFLTAYVASGNNTKIEGKYPLGFYDRNTSTIHMLSKDLLWAVVCEHEKIHHEQSARRFTKFTLVLSNKAWAWYLVWLMPFALLFIAGAFFFFGLQWIGLAIGVIGLAGIIVEGYVFNIIEYKHEEEASRGAVERLSSFKGESKT